MILQARDELFTEERFDLDPECHAARLLQGRKDHSRIGKRIVNDITFVSVIQDRTGTNFDRLLSKDAYGPLRAGPQFPKASSEVVPSYRTL